MSYYIDIIDTVSPLTKLVVEKASASGIELKWNGSDAKDEMYIVTSEFNFDMLTLTAKDAAFIGFFTGDEHRFKVLVKNNEDDSIIWSGYILPDLYSEPYKNGVFFVNFTASDGLGRLKGKKLPDDYYSKEKSLIDIFCQCLKLTGHELDLYFNPAIENFVNKDWDSIFIDTATFTEKDKKKDAFEILETLMKDTLCLCYQCDNHWYIEGINTRHIREVTYKKYDTDGNFVNSVVYNRLLKSITALASPMFTIIPPYNEITITHKKTEPSLPGTLAKETNDGWAVVTGVSAIINANAWMANGGFYAKCIKPDYGVVIYNKYFYNGLLAGGNPQDDTQFVSFKEKLFFSKSQKLNFDFEFKIKKFNESITKPDNMDLWKNPFKYEILFNDVVIFSNFGGTVADQELLIFEDNETAKIDIEHIIQEDGVMDVKIYGPPGQPQENKILGIEIMKMNLSVIAFQEMETITDLINGEFTIDKEIDLIYADDKSGTSKGFRLYPLKENGAFFNEYNFPIFYGFVLNKKNYSVITLEAAVLIKQNLYSVYKDGVLIEVLNVHYNFNDGEQMVIETVVPYTTGNFTVKKYAIDSVLSNRTNWTQWTDSVYKIENTTFIKTVANIYRRLFNQAHEKMDCTALNAVKFNDICLFNYIYEKDFIVLNCSWNLDDNKTNLTLGRSYYRESGTVVVGDDNVPPIVLVGDDIYLDDNQDTATLTATAFDPDGYISAQQWTKKAGDFGDIIETPGQLVTNLSNLKDDFYTYQIQVTDNGGATAMDTINVIRKKDYSVTMDLINETVGGQTSGANYQLKINPLLPDGFVVKLTGVFNCFAFINPQVGDSGSGGYSITKNGFTLDANSYTSGSADYAFTLNVIKTDEIFINLSASVEHGDTGTSGNSGAQMNINKAVFIDGTGTVVGLPVVRSVAASM